MNSFAKFSVRTIKTFAVFALLMILAAVPASAQKKNKKDKSDDPAAQAAAEAALPRSDGSAIDQTVSEFLGYWQIGDTDMLHRYFADNVVVVSGAWEPPIVGWANYLTAYQAQRARITSGRMDRLNTVSNVAGNTAWVTYQWVYTAVVSGNPSVSHGHTTLLMNKQGDRWVIVLNHTSAVDEGTPAPPGTPANPVQSGKP
jgi:ketosteroid isomerase-like protein